MLLPYRRCTGPLLAVIFLGSLVTNLSATDWSRFRGPNGSGVAGGESALPVEWSETQNLQWKVDLPGPGSSGPIVVGDRVFVTCWSGYGLSRENPGDQQNLKRHLLCLDRKSGETLWERTIEAVLPEDEYGGMFAEHGYASHTPASDGERVYVFFGKSGVLAFDLEGNRLWQTSVGTGLDPRRWGSASSPMLYKNLVIVTAAAEDEALVALNKDTGDIVWKKQADGFVGTWSTPILVQTPDCGQDLVLAAPYEIWGFHPETGKLRWYCEASESDSMCASPIAEEGIVYLLGARGGGSVAVRAGGEGDVSESHVVWRGSDQSRIGTPLVHEGFIYSINGGVATCIDAETGERVYQSRLSRSSGNDSGQRGGRGGRRGGFRGQDYSSPVIADGKIYFVARSGESYVLATGLEFRELGKNRFASDDGDFSATPAVSDGQLFIRSSNRLYCVGFPEEG